MKRINLITTAVFALAPLLMTAQVNQGQGVVNSDGRSVSQRKEKSQPATGSMYTNDRFMPAKLSTAANTILVKYNAYSDFFEISDPQNGGTKNLPKDPNTTITFVTDNKTYALVNYTTEKGDQENGYLNVISDNNKVKFYKRERVILQPEMHPANSYQTYKAAHYKKVDDELYVHIEGQGVVPFSSNKKEFARLIPGKDKEVLDFIKKNKISLDEEHDLVKLGVYLETIL